MEGGCAYVQPPLFLCHLVCGAVVLLRSFHFRVFALREIIHQPDIAVVDSNLLRRCARVSFRALLYSSTAESWKSILPGERCDLSAQEILFSGPRICQLIVERGQCNLLIHSNMISHFGRLRTASFCAVLP